MAKPRTCDRGSGGATLLVIRKGYKRQWATHFSPHTVPLYVSSGTYTTRCWKARTHTMQSQSVHIHNATTPFIICVDTHNEPRVDTLKKYDVDCISLLPPTCAVNYTHREREQSDGTHRVNSRAVRPCETTPALVSSWARRHQRNSDRIVQPRPYSLW